MPLAKKQKTSYSELIRIASAHPEWHWNALQVLKIWEKGHMPLLGAVILGLNAAYELGLQQQEPIGHLPGTSFDIDDKFVSSLWQELEVPRPKFVVAIPDDEEEEYAAPVESLSERMSRLAAEARAKPKKRQRR